MTSNDRVRLMIFFHRKKGMSFEDFDKYWRETHAQVACSIPIFTKNLLKYEQIHISPPSFNYWKNSGYQVTDYDGIVVLEATSEDKIKAINEDREYLERLKPDEEKFTERTSFVMMPAKVVTIYDREAGASVK